MRLSSLLLPLSAAFTLPDDDGSLSLLLRRSNNEGPKLARAFSAVYAEAKGARSLLRRSATRMSWSSAREEEICEGAMCRGSCAEPPTPRVDLLSLLALAERVRREDDCELWRAEALSLEACVGPDGVPRRLKQGEKSWLLEEAKVGEQDIDDFSCGQQQRCPEGPPARLTLYRLQGEKEPTSTLRDRNAGDALGEVEFLCPAYLRGQRVSSFDVEVDVAYGTYAFCLYFPWGNHCLGNNSSVGRTSALGRGKGPHHGQCSPNEDVGSWFSLPGAGECQGDAVLGEQNCTWRAKRLRTVSAKCVLERMNTTCKEEKLLDPKNRSAAMLREALEVGGCPDADEAAIMV